MLFMLLYEPLSLYLEEANSHVRRAISTRVINFCIVAHLYVLSNIA